VKGSPFLAHIEMAPWRSVALCFLFVAIARVIAVQLVPISYVTDEATWMAASRWFWLVGQANTHAGRMPVLFPALLSPIFGLLDFERAYPLAKTLNALIATAAIFPIWRLARRFTRDGIAIAVAAISVLGIPASYAAVVMAESVFFFLFWLFLASFGSLVEEPTSARAIGFAVAGSALAATKPQALPALGIAVALLGFWVFWASRRGPAEIVTPFPKKVFALAVGAVLAGLIGVKWVNGGSLAGEFYASSSAIHPLEAGPFFDQAAGLLALLLLGTGILPAAALLESLRGRSSHPLPRCRTFLLASLAIMPVVYLLLASAFAVVMSRDRLQERYVSFAYPAVLLLAAGLTQRNRDRRSVATAAIAGLAAAALVWYGISQYPASDVLEVADAPTRAAIPRLPGLSGEEAPIAGAIAGIVVAGGCLLRGVAPRLAATGALTALLTIGVSIAQIRWSSTWGVEHYRRLRVESVLIPPGAPVVVLAEHVPDDILLFETARRVERLRILSAAHLAVDGPGGEVRAASPAALEEYWVATRQTLLRNELVYSEAGHRVYRVSSSPPRILARLLERPGALEIEYYPADPWTDEVTFVLEAQAKAVEAPARTEPSAESGARSMRFSKDAAVVEVASRRGADGAFREVLRISGCGDVSLLSDACPVLKRLFVKSGEGGSVLDDLYP